MGRVQELEDLHRLLQTSDRVAIVAATGMGGIGKTQLAWHYLAQNCDSYPAGIWWLRAGQLVSQVFESAAGVGAVPKSGGVGSGAGAGDLAILAAVAAKGGTVGGGG